MALGCVICIMTKGLKGSEIEDLPQTEEELIEHIESEHHLPVKRDNENEKQMLERFKREYPEAGGINCKCPGCVRKRGIIKLRESILN